MGPVLADSPDNCASIILGPLGADQPARVDVPGSVLGNLQPLDHIYSERSGLLDLL